MTIIAISKELLTVKELLSFQIETPVATERYPAFGESCGRNRYAAKICFIAATNLFSGVLVMQQRNRDAIVKLMS